MKRIAIYSIDRKTSNKNKSSKRSADALSHTNWHPWARGCPGFACQDRAQLSPRVRIVVNSSEVIIVVFRVQVTAEDQIASNSKVNKKRKEQAERWQG